MEKPRNIARPALTPRPSLVFPSVEGGPVGFKNQGNTCYLNTAVQLLFNINELRDYINQEGPNATEGELLSILHELLHIETVSASETHLRKLRAILLKKGMDKGLNLSSNGQKDAHEAVNIILGELNWHPMSVRNRYESRDDSNLSCVSDKQNTYGLEIQLEDSKAAVDFQKLIDGYFAPEIMPRDAHVTMNNEEIYNLEKTPVITKAPSHLIISLKRFRYNRDTRISRKVLTPVKSPTNLTVEIPRGSKKIQYEIVGYGNHGGTVTGGHYTAHVKNCQDPEDKRRWIKCNDSSITVETPPNESSAAYLVVLKRKED